jgi:hypothetical protein
MSFPVLTAAAVGLTGLFIRKPWNERRARDAEREAAIEPIMTDDDVLIDLDRATRLIDQAQRKLQHQL